MAELRRTGPWWELAILSDEYGDWISTLPEQMSPPEFAETVLGVLSPAEREAVIRKAAKQAGLRVLTTDQANLAFAAMDKVDRRDPRGGWAAPNSLWSKTKAALRGEEAPTGAS
jgi:hypothetical protein